MKKRLLKLGFVLLFGIMMFVAQNVSLTIVWASNSTGGFSYLENRVPHISASRYHVVGLKTDRTVVGVGYSGSTNGIAGTASWTNVKGLYGGLLNTLALKTDGTVVGTGDNSYGQLNVASWTNITGIALGTFQSLGLKDDGSVVATGHNGYNQLNVNSWTNVVAVASGQEHSVALKADGTVVATGRNSEGQCNTAGWTNIVAIEAGMHNTFGLKADGTVVYTGDNTYGQTSGVASWTGIVKISASDYNTVGLKADGTVVSIGNNGNSQNNVSAWTNIIDVSSGGEFVAGLKSDGTVVAIGRNDYGQCNVSTWSLKIYNRAPVISLTFPVSNNNISEITGYNTFTLTGKVYDLDANTLTISASINGVSKSTSLTAPTSLPGSNNWSLSWSGAEVSEGQYTNIVITASDTERTHTATYSYILKVDKTAPTTPILSMSNVEWTNNSVTFTVTHGSDSGSGVLKSQYKLNAGAWTDYSSTVTISASGSTTVEIKTLDNAGNISTITSGLAKVDKVAPASPTISLSSTDWTAGSVTVTLSGGSDALSGVSRLEYRIGAGGTWNTYTAAFAVYESGTTAIYARTVDNAGNSTIAPISYTKVIVNNGTGPLVTLLINNGASYTTSTSVTLTITAIDNITQTSSLKVKFSNDNVSWSTQEAFVSTKAWTVTAGDGQKTVYVQVQDTDGNITATKATVNLSTATPSNSSSSSSSGTLIGGYYYIKDNEVSISMTNSGAATTRYSVSEGVWSEWENVAASKTLQLPSGDGKKKIQFQLKNANEKPSSVYTVSFILDTATPTFNLSTLNGATATSTGNITLEVTDLIDNVYTTGFKYSINGGAQNSLPVNNQIGVTGLTTGLQTIRIRIYDQAGNYSEKSVKVWRL